MDGTKHAYGPSGRRRWLAALLVAAASFAPAAMEASAAPMRGRGPARLSAEAPLVANAFGGSTLSPAWDAFLGMGPEGWSMYQSPALTFPTRMAVWRMLESASDSVTLDPMLEYLIWRRDLNPGRFDYYHPYLGPRLGQLLQPPLTPPPPLEVPEEVAPITPPPPQTIPEPQVPEPDGWIIAVLASAWGVWRRRPRAVPAR